MDVRLPFPPICISRESFIQSQILNSLIVFGIRFMNEFQSENQIQTSSTINLTLSF